MSEIHFVDTTLRDGQQSLWALGMKTGAMLPIAAQMDRIGFESMEFFVSIMIKKYVRWGAGPRAGQALILGAKAHALLAGRFAVSPADILRVARPVLRHRVLPNFAAEAKGVTAEQIIDRLIEDVKPPKSEIKL